MNSKLKSILTSWHLWAILIILGVMILFRNQISTSLVLPLVLVLVCPIMMTLMMKDGHKH